MGATILSCTQANVDFVQLADSAGRLVLLPKACVDNELRAGHETLHLVISLTGEPPRPWLTVSEAARLHVDDVDGRSFESAKALISQACQRGQIVSTGEGTRRRIDPVSLDAWRLQQRERDLDRADRETMAD